MAAGLLVVGTNTGGIPYLVRNGATGWLVPPGDPRAMANTIQRAVTDALELTGRRLAISSDFFQRFQWGWIGSELAKVIVTAAHDRGVTNSVDAE
jgi:glycosyltransferase involved in cell wall biosynthesis